MNYVFFGTPEFAATVLKKMIDAGLAPRALVCNPDRPVGRKKIITPSPTKQVIREKGLEESVKILQPESLSYILFPLSSYQPDLFIVAAYGKIIPKEILEIPRLGSVGVHPSLLPKYRGASPIQSAILNGETETGVTLYLMDEKVDHGPVIAEREVPIANRNYQELSKELADAGGGFLIEILPKFLNGEVKPKPQDESEATYTKKFNSDDGFVSEKDLSEAESGAAPDLAMQIERKIRALNPGPGVWTIQNGKRIKLLESEIQNRTFKIKKMQVEGQKPKTIS